MKRIMTAVLIVFALAAGAVLAWNSMAAERGRKAVLVGVKGTVQVQKGGKGEKVQAVDNTELFQGDVVYTKGGSSVLLKFDDGSMVKLGSLTRLSIDRSQSMGQKKATELNVGSGKVWSRVNKLTDESSFQVKTPTAVAGVRGTYYSSQVDNDDTSRFDVFEGEVAVSSRANPAEQIVVKKNQTTSVSTGKAPDEPTQIPQEELDKEKAGFSDNEYTSAAYDLEVNVYPQEVGPGQTASVTVQVFRDGSPAQEQVNLTVTLGGAATFVSNGSNKIEVNTNDSGVASLEIMSEKEETVSIGVKMKARVRKN